MLEDFKGMKCLGRTAVSALFKFAILVLNRGAPGPSQDGDSGCDSGKKPIVRISRSCYNWVNLSPPVSLAQLRSGGRKGKSL